MPAAQLVREARRRAGLTQSELARRVGTTQSAIARIEAGGSEPSLARVDLLVAACGQRLAISLEVDVVPERPPAAVLQARWDDAVRMANFVLDGRRSVSAG